MRSLITILFIFSTLFPILGWAKTGHRVIGEIAQRNLSDKALVKLKNLMGPESLAEAGNWPDSMRSNDSWRCASPLHYVSIEDGEKYSNSAQSERGDIVKAISEFAEVFIDKKTNRKTKINALRFLVHLVGDLHQPLHVGVKCDRGGNKIKVKWFYQKSNLHTVWDGSIIDQQKLSYTEYSSQLNVASKSDIKKWQSTGLLKWTHESRDLRKKAYQCYKGDNCSTGSFYSSKCSTIPTEINMKYKYEYEMLPTIKKQLLKGGIRLAGLLEIMLVNNKLPKSFKKDERKIKKLATGRGLALKCLKAN